MKLTQFQHQELARLWFDLSKLTLGSLILKLLDPSIAEVSLRSILTIISGLILALIFAILGLLFSTGVKDKK